MDSQKLDRQQYSLKSPKIGTHTNINDYLSFNSKSSNKIDSYNSEGGQSKKYKHFNKINLINNGNKNIKAKNKDQSYSSTNRYNSIYTYSSNKLFEGDDIAHRSQSTGRIKAKYKNKEISRLENKKKGIHKKQQKDQQPKDIVMLKQIRKVLAQIKRNFYHYCKSIKTSYNDMKQQCLFNQQKQLTCMRQLGQLSRLLFMTRLQYIPYLINLQQDFVFFTWAFSAISVSIYGNKQIAISIIHKTIQAYFHHFIDMLTKQKQQINSNTKQFQLFLSNIDNYLNLTDFCLEIIQSKQSIIHKTVVQSLQKIQQWTTIFLQLNVNQLKSKKYYKALLNIKQKINQILHS